MTRRDGDEIVRRSHQAIDRLHADSREMERLLREHERQARHLATSRPHRRRDDSVRPRGGSRRH